MYIHEPCYELGELMRENLHIHTAFSSCASREMTVEAIFNKAQELGLSTIALTDHYHAGTEDDEALENLNSIKKQGEAIEHGFKVLYGMELSANAVGKTVEGAALRDALDYRLYACNHYHLGFWEHPKKKSVRDYALHEIANVTALIKSGKADCIAHPLMAKYIGKFRDKTRVAAAVTDNELGDLLTLAKENRVAWEINIVAAGVDPELTRRTWNIGREVGACFNLGSDAHNLSAMDVSASYDKLCKILGV